MDGAAIEAGYAAQNRRPDVGMDAGECAMLIHGALAVGSARSAGGCMQRECCDQPPAS